MPKVTVIDYGIGNVLSVTRAFEHCGAEVELTCVPERIRDAEILVLPGVGAFADGMKGLRDRGLVEPIRRFAEKERYFLGICLGMQMMMDESEEFGNCEGLGLISGKVAEIERTTLEGLPHKIPHIGWNGLTLPADADKARWDNTILTGMDEGETVYFVHSFTAFPEDPRNRLADAFYGGRLISAAIQKGTLYGCQFHPEKSGRAGLTILKNFLKLHAMDSGR